MTFREIRRSVSSYAPPTSEVNLPGRPRLSRLVDRVARPLVGLGESAGALGKSLYWAIGIQYYRMRRDDRFREIVTQASRRAWNRSTHILDNVLRGRRSDPLYLILNSYHQDVDMERLWHAHEYDIEDIIQRVPLDLDSDRIRILNDLFSIRSPMRTHEIWRRILDRASDQLEPGPLERLTHRLAFYMISEINPGREVLAVVVEPPDGWAAQGNSTIDDVNAAATVSRTQRRPHSLNYRSVPE